jgi:hypothetical protein
VCEEARRGDEPDLKDYIKYLLKEGSIIEKRELLANLKSMLVLKDKEIALKPAES